MPSDVLEGIRGLLQCLYGNLLFDSNSDYFSVGCACMFISVRMVDGCVMKQPYTSSLFLMVTLLPGEIPVT
jgi:hypothetical protein